MFFHALFLFGIAASAIPLHARIETAFLSNDTVLFRDTMYTVFVGNGVTACGCWIDRALQTDQVEFLKILLEEQPFQQACSANRISRQLFMQNIRGNRLRTIAYLLYTHPYAIQHIWRSSTDILQTIRYLRDQHRNDLANIVEDIAETPSIRPASYQRNQLKLNQQQLSQLVFSEHLDIAQTLFSNLAINPYGKNCWLYVRSLYVDDTSAAWKSLMYNVLESRIDFAEKCLLHTTTYLLALRKFVPAIELLARHKLPANQEGHLAKLVEDVRLLVSQKHYRHQLLSMLEAK